MDQAFYTALSCLFLGLLLAPSIFTRHGARRDMDKSLTWRFMQGLLSAAKKRINAWLFLFRGPSMIQEEYEKVRPL